MPQTTMLLLILLPTGFASRILDGLTKCLGWAIRNKTYCTIICMEKKIFPKIGWKRQKGKKYFYLQN